MKLYIRYASDDPHVLGNNGKTRCGLPLAGAQVITEEQALVWLDNRRCPRCLPSHTAQEGHRRHG